MSLNGISIIVPTFQRQHHLERCMKSLLKLQFKPLEIIIVDDGSTDDTWRYLSNLSDPRLRIIRRSCNGGASKARNTGIAAASFDLIAFTDDDCIVNQDWLANLIAPFRDTECGFVIGQTWYRHQSYQGQFPERLVHNHDAAWPMTCNMAYRREIFDQIGSFDENYAYFHNEDTEMAMRAVAAGWNFGRALDAQVFHQEARWTPHTLLSSARNCGAVALLKKDYPEHHECFGKQTFGNYLIRPKDYLTILCLPLIIPVQFIRYIVRGENDIWLFLSKWPLHILARRYHVYRMAWLTRRLIL